MTFTNKFSPAARIVAIAAVTILAASCKKEIPEDAIVTVGNSTLTVRNLKSAIPIGLNEADSTSFAESYISSWISDQLVTEVAEKNLPDTHEIDMMTEEYRRNLIMWEYIRLKTAQNPMLAANPDSVSAYFKAHGSEFKTTEPMVKGVYIRINSDSPLLADVNRWYKSDSASDMDKLEKTCMRDREIAYDYFRDKWIPLSQIRSALPPGTEITSLSAGTNVEAKSADRQHLLHLTDILPVGSPMPEEVAAPLISRRIEAQNRTDVERTLRQDLYRQAQSSGKLIFYDRH